MKTTLRTLLLPKKRLERETEKAYCFTTSAYCNFSKAWSWFNVPKSVSKIEELTEDVIAVKIPEWLYNNIKKDSESDQLNGGALIYEMSKETTKNLKNKSLIKT